MTEEEARQAGSVLLRQSPQKAGALVLLGLACGLLLGLWLSPRLLGAPLTGPDAARRRIAYLVLHPEVEADAAGWKQWAQDARRVRQALGAQEQNIFDLVAAKRGLTTAGKPDLALLRQACQRLRWPSCDPEVLLSRVEREGEDEISLAVRELTWQFGDGAAVRKMVERELAAVPEADKDRRVRTLVRAALISDNPEGQSAIFSQVCALEPQLCKEPQLMRSRAQEEASLRRASPGNSLPIIFFGAEHTVSSAP